MNFASDQSIVKVVSVFINLYTSLSVCMLKALWNRRL